MTLDNWRSVMDCDVTSKMGRRRPSRHWELKRQTERERLASLVTQELHAGRFDGIDQINSSLDGVDQPN